MAVEMAAGAETRPAETTVANAAIAKSKLAGRELYCANIIDKASDARFALQRDELRDLQLEIQQKLDELGRRQADLETWVTRRNDFLSKIQGGVADIYARMKPELAAEQLSKLERMTAAAIMLKLNSRTASLIMGEMDPAKAADLTQLFASASHIPLHQCN